MSNISNMGKRPVSTTLQSRTAMFLPVMKLSGSFDGSTDIVVENSVGKITLRDCKLTQVHRNIVDLIFSNHEPIKTYDNGDVAYVFSKYEILKLLGHEAKRNGHWLERKFEEMRMASVVLEIENAERSDVKYQGVITRHQETLIKGAMNQPLYGVIFSEAFMAMFDADIRIHSALLTNKIIHLQHAVTQAFTRCCISHRKLNRDLEEMLEYIGINKERLAQRTYRRKIREIVSEAEELRDVFGIDIRKMKNGKWGVFYEQHEDVWFSNPPKPTALKDQAAEQAVLELETDTDTSSD